MKLGSSTLLPGNKNQYKRLPHKSGIVSGEGQKRGIRALPCSPGIEIGWLVVVELPNTRQLSCFGRLPEKRETGVFGFGETPRKMAVAQKRGTKMAPKGQWNQRLKPKTSPSSLILNHTQTSMVCVDIKMAGVMLVFPFKF